jgi:hypothetical protein
MIVYGRNHFLVKKINPREIGFFDQEYKGLYFELRQKYGHLYWIPFFPLGQQWFLRKNGELYVLQPTVERVIKSKFPSTLDWKAFALPIIVLVGFFIFIVSEKIKSYKDDENAKIENIARITKIKSHLYSLNTSSYLEFEKNYEKLYFKVSKTTKDSVELIEFESPLPETASFFDETNYRADLLYLKLQIAKGLDTVWVNRKEIVGAIKDDASTNPKQIKTSKSVLQMDLNAVIQFDDAQFVETTTPESKSIYYYELQNLGLDAHIDSIAAIKGEVWEVSKKRDVNLLDKFALRTENGTQASLYYTCLENHKKHVLKLTRSNGQLFMDSGNKLD